MSAGTPNGIVWQRMAELSQASLDFGSDESILSRVTAAAVELIPGASCADVLIIENGNFRSVASTSEIPSTLDNAQKMYSEGPCLDAIVADSVIRASDFRTETRWPTFREAAVDNGVHSALSYQLYATGTGRAALNIFGNEPDAFDIEAEQIGTMLATHAAQVLRASDKKQQFDSALASRDLIGQAKGMIMERFAIDAVQAFELMAKLSQESNLPVRELARDIVAKGSARS